MLRVVLVLSLAALSGAADLPPTLKEMLRLAKESPEELIKHIQASPLSIVLPEIQVPATGVVTNALPTVMAHGMGDSCFNPGMKSITTAVGKHMGSYAVCVPTADSQIWDTIDGFLKNMDKSVDFFADKIRKDPKLAGGFNAAGFSQGNSLIRGYIQKYNDPPVHTFLSVHGTGMGVTALPGCFDQGKPLGFICKVVAEVLGDFAYISLVQDILFQANYYRDPLRENSSAYLEHSQIAQWNLENSKTANATFKENFGKTKRYAMVKALQDQMVYPNECEWWGDLAPGKYGPALAMKDTKFYKEDTFGLRTADEAGKIAFETTPGGHLQFTDKELFGWVDKYFQTQDETLLQV